MDELEAVFSDKPEDLEISPGIISDRKVIPSGYYSATIVAAGALANPYWDTYVAQCEKEGFEPNPAKKKQIQLDLEVVYEGESLNLRHWVSPIVSKNSKTKKSSNLLKLVEAIGMDPKAHFLTSELVGKELKINIIKANKDDGTEYNKVVGGIYESV